MFFVENFKGILTLIVPYKFSGYRPKIPWKICHFWGIY